MPHRASPIKLEDFASKAVALQILKAGCKIDNLPDRHDLSSHENNSIDNDRKPGELRYSVEKVNDKVSENNMKFSCFGFILGPVTVSFCQGF